MDHTLTKARRLTKAEEFSHVFDHNSLKAHSKHFLMLAVPLAAGEPRLGLVISKKNVGCAVARNRIKRLCREAFRHHWATLPALDIVVLAKPGVSQLTNANIHALLVQLFDKLRASHASAKPPSTPPSSELTHDQTPS